eukprot:CAMPEP_0174297760 /NCGR_PEP_ID=MMETSP0809-20121228/51876_1 /TAXON_ID=73025 ORGANISM="Eutreptiella gymnastica-like, Strain CCMP1594" /NCGR_SAMPLE_ID=MMETSP0809 /ASSEMBLY_ACC=CAM_ASM_000658 /LENGTH=82 /DNA_ID=CAMNT_0015401751 /DNA_START=260 /DNA_END=508 /DNA_ORIENTATION=+
MPVPHESIDPDPADHMGRATEADRMHLNDRPIKVSRGTASDQILGSLCCLWPNNGFQLCSTHEVLSSEATRILTSSDRGCGA